jgi:glycosyltransferase involved in cell wall biosynthesis
VKILVVDSTAVEGIETGPGSPAYFSRFVIEHLVENDHEVLISNNPKPEMVKDADVVWSEWCNEIAFGIAKSGLAKKLIIRMRGYDVWMPLEQMVWNNVDTLVFESKFLALLASERFTAIHDHLDTCIIPSGIDLNANVFHAKRRPERPRLALIARTTADKGYQLAFEYARSRPGIDLHVTTAFSESNPRLLRYLQHSTPANVTIHGNVDTSAWLSEINASHILSASIWETLGYTIAEGMAAGCKPLIHDAPGLGVNWPKEYLWTGFGDLDKLIAGSFEPQKYRNYVEQNLSAERGTKAFVKLVLE